MASPLALGSVEPAMASASIERHVAGQRKRAGLAHLAHDEDALAPVLLDAHGDLRVLQEAVGELLLQIALELPQGAAGRPSRGR